MQKLSIIVPAFNEERTIKEVLKILVDLKLYQGIAKEIIIVNDASSDNTKKIIEDFITNTSEADIQLVHQAVNQGKGAALHLGIKEATGDYIIPQDADLELDPADINKLLEKAMDENLDIVYGSRFIEDEAKRNLAWMANHFLTSMTNVLGKFKLTDMECCYKLIRTSIAQSLELKEKRFGFEPEITLKLGKVPNVSFGEVSISYEQRTYEEGKKIGWKDGLHALHCLIKYR